MQQFKEEICKTLEVTVQSIDIKLVTIGQKIDSLEKGQHEFSQRVEKLTTQVLKTKERETQLEKVLVLLVDELKNTKVYSEEAQKIAENADNSLWRDNRHLRGLKEGAEGDNLKVFLENLFMTSIGSDSNVEVKLKSAYRIANYGQLRGKARDRDILMTFQEGSLKALALNALWEQPKLIVAGQELTFLSDLPCCFEKKA